MISPPSKHMPTDLTFHFASTLSVDPLFCLSVSPHLGSGSPPDPLTVSGRPPASPCAVPPLQVVPGVPFFASKVQLGPNGVQQVLGLGNLTDYERAALDAMLPELTAQIQKVS